MTKVNTWHQGQPRTNKKTFRPKWDKDTILWIIQQVKEMTPFVDIQYALVKKFEIHVMTADRWIELAKSIMKDMDNGLNLEESLKRDQERRNMLRRKK